MEISRDWGTKRTLRDVLIAGRAEVVHSVHVPPVPVLGQRCVELVLVHSLVRPVEKQ